MGDKLSTFWFADVRLHAATTQSNQMLLGELRGTDFVQRAAIPLALAMRPAGLAYNPARRLLAWSEGVSSKTVYLARLGATDGTSGARIALTNDVPGLAPFRFSDDGRYLAAAREPDILRVWNIETGQIVVSINQNFISVEGDATPAQRTCFAANGDVLVVVLHHRVREEIGFYNLARPDLEPRRVPGGFVDQTVVASPDGKLVAASSLDGQVLLFDATMGKQINSFYGHHPSASGVAFSPDGRRLISSCKGREAGKLWDVGTGQELLTLAGADRFLNKARWSSDGDSILAGPPWQVWTAPSWEEIAAAEAKEKSR